MHRRLGIASLVAVALALSTQIQARPPVAARPAPSSGDPCNFTTSFGFGYDQVLACYRSVPFCPDSTDPVSCDRDAQVKHLRRAIEGFSDLREIYEPVAHWRRKLDAVANADFKTDYDFFLAMGDVMASFRNPHWSYFGPRCFEETLFALNPLNFSSMIARVTGVEQQVIYLREPIPFFDSLYATATGIDVTPYTGQRVVLINGEPPLRFFRRWAREGLHQDVDDGINLMEVFDDLGYTLRAGSFNAFPESRSVRLVLETRAGVRTKVELPWAFIPFTEFGFPGPPPASSEEFRARCFEPAPASGAAARQMAPGSRTVREPIAYDVRVAQRREWVAALAARHPARHGSPPPAGFSEVPPEKLNQDITEILPSTDGSRTVAYTSDTVAIQLRGDFMRDWDDEFAAGATYACDHADRLIVDLRGNLGGFVSRAQSFAHYLNPTAPAVPNAVFGYRELARSPALNELRRLSEPLAALGYPPCTSGYEPACLLRLPSGRPVTDTRWYTNVTLERRGGVLQSLTPLVTFGLNVPPEDRVIPCAGKFTGKNLIVLLNGVNGSAAFFAPQLLDRIGTLVVAGGFVNEPMFTGRSRGGPVVHTSDFQDDADFLRDATGVEARFRLPDLPRAMGFRMEWKAFYKPDLKHLYVDHPPFGDLQIPFWSNLRETDGAAYRAAVSAVERHALVDPVCGPPSEAHSCGLYDRCARRTLDTAVLRGAITSETAARTLEDASTACRAKGPERY